MCRTSSAESACQTLCGISQWICQCSSDVDTFSECTQFVSVSKNSSLSSEASQRHSVLCCAVRHQILAAKKEGKVPPPLPMPDVSNGHVLAVHRLHAADAEDAWLQREWGEIQMAQGNPSQAATHFEVTQLPITWHLSSRTRLVRCSTLRGWVRLVQAHSEKTWPH